MSNNYNLRERKSNTKTLTTEIKSSIEGILKETGLRNSYFLGKIKLGADLNSKHNGFFNFNKEFDGYSFNLNSSSILSDVFRYKVHVKPVTEDKHHSITLIKSPLNDTNPLIPIKIISALALQGYAVNYRKTFFSNPEATPKDSSHFLTVL